MGQDFTKGLNVCIGNYGYYNEGSLHDAWITLPKTEAEIRDFLHLNQLQDSQHEEIYISDYDGIPSGCLLHPTVLTRNDYAICKPYVRKFILQP